jgi:hypothetical protein
VSPALVQSAPGEATSGTTVTVTLTSPTGAGNCLAVCIGGSQGTTNPTVSGITLGGSPDNFNRAEAVNNNADTDCEIWLDPGCAGGRTSVVVTFNAGTGSTPGMSVWVMEWSGVTPVSPADKTNGQNGAATSWSSLSSGTLSQAVEVVIGAVSVAGGTGVTLTGPSSPWTNLAQENGGDSVALMAGYQAVIATTAQTYSGTSSLDAAYGAVIVTLRGPVISPGGSLRAAPGRTWTRRFQPWRRAVQAQAMPGPVTVISGSLAMSPMAIAGSGGLTPPPGPPPAALPGVTWRRRFRRGRRPAAPVQRTAPAAITMSGSLAMAPMAVSGTMPAPTFQPIAPAAAQPGRAWKRRFQPWRKAVQELLQPAPVLISGSLAMAPMALSGSEIAAYPFPEDPLGTKVEVLLNGTWTDITSYVLQVQPVKITRGRPDETQSVTAASCTMRVLNTDGRFSVSNAAGAFAPYLTRNVQLRVSVTAATAPLLTLVDAYSATYLDTYGTPGMTQAIYSGYRFWGEIAAFAPGWDESGNYRYVDLTAAGPIRRYSQGNATIGSALRRYYTRLTGSKAPYGYWTCEDGSGATEFASYVTGVPAMGFTGSPDLASDSSFGGSDPIPSVNDSSWHGQTLAASSPPGSGSITQITPGTYEWACPPGVTEVTDVDAIAGGGGGGAAGPAAGGGGGGGGGQSLASSIGVTAGVAYVYVVGEGGQGGASIGAGGGAGGASSWTGNTQACTAGGGGGGTGGNTSTGGEGGTGQNAGGEGGTGQESITTSGSLSFSANTGATGTAAGGTADPAQAGFTWTSPAGCTSIDAAVGGGAGGGAGGGEESNGSGGGGGGGGGLSSATVVVQPLTTYTFFAGNGGDGGASASDGETGGDSTITGDTSGAGVTAITAGGGSGGSGSSGSGGGDGNDQGGSFGGNSTESVDGHGMGGGGGGGGGGGDQGNGGQAGSGDDPRPPGAGGGNGAGGGWGAASNGGTGATNGGTGQNGTVGSSGAGGGGGGGAVDLTDGNAGGGGGAGWAAWSWSVTGPAGGGGGGSGGTTGPGNAGSNDGTGGLPGSGGGGQGGNQGAASGVNGPGTGGGGGGGIPASATTTAAAASNGGAGQVSFSWSGGTVSPVAADIVRFLLEVVTGGGVDGTVLARVYTYGTVARLDLLYRTASGGSLELTGYNSGGSQLFDSGTLTFALNGVPCMIDVELTANGSGGATWSLAMIEPGADTPNATYTGSVGTVTVSNVSDVYVSPDGDVNFASVGHPAVQTYADSLAVLAQVMAGYAGELAETRLARLCSEEGLTFTLTGPSGVTPAMQAQQDDTFVNVIQSCEDADRGLLFESRDSFGLAYCSRVSLQGQTPALTMDYSQAEVASPMSPTADDQYTRNDIELTRNNGSSFTAVQQTGPMSVNAPPLGVGDYLYTLTTYVYEDSQLANMGAWMLIVGTVADERFPTISIDMSRSEIVALFSTAATADMGDYLQVTNPPSWLTSMPIQQLAWGVTETLSNYIWRIDWNAVPESPYSTGNPPAW